MARLVTSRDGARLVLPGRASREVLAGSMGAAGVTFRIVEIAPEQEDGPARGPHVHLGFEECIHVQSGRGVTETDSGMLPLAPGDTVLVPAGELHMTRNTGDDPLVLLCFFPVADIRPGTREFASWDAARSAS